MAAQTRSEPDMTDPELEYELEYGEVFCLECGCVITVEEEEYEQTPEGYICEDCLDGAMACWAAWRMEDDNDEIEDDFDDDEEDE